VSEVVLKRKRNGEYSITSDMKLLIWRCLIFLLPALSSCSTFWTQTSFFNDDSARARVFLTRPQHSTASLKVSFFDKSGKVLDVQEIPKPIKGFARFELVSFVDDTLVLSLQNRKSRTVGNLHVTIGKAPAILPEGSD
jgi:hypothetical protein